MDDHQRETVGPRAEEAGITERKIAGESVDDVDALRQHHEDHEIEQQQMIAVDARQYREGGHQRHKNQQNVAKHSRHDAPVVPKARSAAPGGSQWAGDTATDGPTSCNSSA